MTNCNAILLVCIFSNNNINLKLTFKNIYEFEELLNHYMKEKELRKSFSRNAINYINSELPESKLSNLWSNIFN